MGPTPRLVARRQGGNPPVSGISRGGIPSGRAKGREEGGLPAERNPSWLLDPGSAPPRTSAGSRSLLRRRLADLPLLSTRRLTSGSTRSGPGSRLISSLASFKRPTTASQRRLTSAVGSLCHLRSNQRTKRLQVSRERDGRAKTKVQEVSALRYFFFFLL